MNEKREIRVFVSSTFLDMRLERNHLVKVVFPQLRKLCEARGVTWGEVDLRWGITSEEAAEGKTLSICLDEIDRCRPYFIGLLGERYGWIPQQIDLELAERQPWLAAHRDVSVTELEIIHGVLRHESLSGRCYFYFRDPAYLDASRAEFGSESAAAHAKLNRLKSRIRDASREGRCRLHEGFRDPVDLGRLILEDFTSFIDRQFPVAEVPTRLAIEQANQLAFANSRAQVYVGREKYLEELDRYVDSGGPPLVVLGEPGIGKTALIANWSLCYRQSHPDEFFFMHFVGGPPESASAVRIVRRLLEELKKQYPDVLADLLPETDESVLDTFPRWLNQAAATARRLVLVLDGLDQIEDRAGADAVGWLPQTFPPNVRVVVSTLPGKALDALRRRGWSELAVEELTRGERRQLIEAFLARFSKRLSAAELERLASSPQCGNALFLRAVVDELRQFGDFEKLSARLTHYLAAADPQELYALIIDRWAEDFGKELVWSTLVLIWAARRGLSEAELLDLLGESEDPLPHAVWIPFFLALGSSVVSHSGLLKFSHESVRLAAETRLLQGDAQKKAAHVALGDYFASRWEWTERKLDELPWQWLRAAEWDRLEDTVTTIDVFKRLHSDTWRKWDLQNYWLALKPHCQAVDGYRRGLANWELTPRQPAELALHLVELANFHAERAEREEAERLYRRALDIRDAEWGVGNARSAIVLNNLALLLDESGKTGEALTLLQKALPAFDRLGQSDPVIATVLGNLSQMLQKLGRSTDAEDAIRRAIAIDQKALGSDDIRVARDLHNLAELLTELGRPEEALPIQTRALAIYEKRLGSQEPGIAMVVNGLAKVLLAMRRPQEAEPLLRRAVAIARTSFGTAHHTVSLYLNNLGRALRDLHRDAEAESLLREALSIDEAIGGPDHPDVASSLVNLGGLLDQMGKAEESETMLRRALAIGERRYGVDSINLVETLYELAATMYRQVRLHESEELLRRALQIMSTFSAANEGIRQRHWQTTKDAYSSLLRTMGVNEALIAKRLAAIQ